MTNQPIQVNTNFFTVQGIDYTSTYGACSTTDNFNVLYDKVVKFSGDLKYSCNYLKSSGLTYAALSSLQVFNNLYKLMSDVNDFYIGIYGNSNFNYIKDWLKVQIKDTKSALETSINTDQNIPRRLLLFVGYNKMGANGDEQYYVSSASLQFTDYIKASEITTTYVQFTFEVKFEELMKDEIENEKPKTPSIFPQFPTDIFYPIWYEGGSLLEFSYVLVGILLFCLQEMNQH